MLFNYLKDNAKTIHFFGLGFVQVKANDFERYHFYLEELPAFVESPHNHRYNFISEVLKGEIFQSIFTFNADHDGMSIMSDVSCKNGEVVEAPAKWGKLKQIFNSSHGAGSIYGINKGVFHTIKAINKPTITVVTRNSPSKALAQVVRQHGEEAICPFSQKYEEDYLWGLVKEACGDLDAK